MYACRATRLTHIIVDQPAVSQSRACLVTMYHGLTMLRVSRTMLNKTTRSFFTSRARGTSTSTGRSIMKLSVVSASVGVLMGAGYSGYTHLQINQTKSQAPLTDQHHNETLVLDHLPDVLPTRRVRLTSITFLSDLFSYLLLQYVIIEFCDVYEKIFNRKT